MIAATVAWHTADARAAGPALDKPAFMATPAELLAEAKAAPAADSDIAILRHDEELSVDERGRRARRVRIVYVVRTQNGVDEGATLDWPWTPYHQDRPRMRARVIEPNGAATELDSKLVTDAPMSSAGSAGSGDARLLSAQLPRIRIGAVVEYEIVAGEHQARLAAGDAGLIWLDNSLPIGSLRLTLSAPAARKAKLVERWPGGPRAVHEIVGGRERWTYAANAVAPPAIPEAWRPSDGLSTPYVGLSAATWGDVAREYHQSVERRIADGPARLPAELPRAPTLDAVLAITAWMHRQVRTTYVELGQTSIVPGAPAETLQRGFGDSKDKATLLVALLRQAGVRAELALLSPGPGYDADVELPGIQWFKHAIVRAQVGGRDVWIDAAEDLVRPGRLPARDQGRRALIAAADTTGLALTPAAVPADNAIRQLRTFTLSENGLARVTEVETLGGVFEADARRWIRDGRVAAVQGQLARYAEHQYGAEYVRHSTTPPDDLAAPFTVTLELKDAARAWTDRAQIAIELAPADTLARVPDYLLHVDTPRRADFAWSTPYVFEIEHRLIVPPGYTLPTLPADRATPLGSANLTERYHVDSGTIVATFRFDSGRPRLTPAEVARLRKELALVRDRKVKIEIQRTAARLAAAGKLHEAVAEIERLIQLHPAEAIHHDELAMLYTDVGMGMAARRAARRAVALEPNSADAHSVLGWVLRLDTFGRHLGFDHDRAGALAASARARQLAPKSAAIAADHADLLHRDPLGIPYGRGADLPGAIEARRAAHALEASAENGQALAEALFHGGSLAEAEQVLRAMVPSAARDSLLVGVVAASPGGAAAAVQLASSLRSGPALATLLLTATQYLMTSRRYDAMRALVAQGGIWAPGSSQHRITQRIAPVPPVPKGPDPEPLAAVMARMLVEPDRVTQAFWDVQTADEIRQPAWRRLSPVKFGMPSDVFADLSHAMVDVSVTGDSAAWRIELKTSTGTSFAYAALDRGVAKLVGHASRPAGLGRHVLRLVARNELTAAARCLDWLLQDAPPVAQQLTSLWGAGLPRDRDAIALAGALVANDSDPAHTIAITTRCPSQLPKARAECDRALAGALRKQRRWRELAAHAAAWSGRAADRGPATVAQLEALTMLGRFDEAEHARAAAGVATPGDIEVARAGANISLQRRDLPEAVRRLDALLSRADSSANDLNIAAWTRLFLQADLVRALELARKASGPDRTKAPYPALHTLASVEAELGDVQTAKLDAWQAMESIERAVPASPDWYVYGRIAEQLGLRDDAIAAYRCCADESPYPYGSRDLARLRLARLGARP